MLWEPHPLYLALGKTSESRAACYRELFKGHIDSNLLSRIREAVNQSMVLGNERFKEDIEILSGRRTSPLKRGPKPKTSKEFLLCPQIC